MADTTEREVLLNVHANTEDALNNIVKLRKANEELRQSLTNDKNALVEMQKAAQDAGGATSEQAAQMDTLRKNIETTAQQIKANTAAINGNLKAVDLSIAKAEQAVLFAARPLYFFWLIFFPVIRTFDFVAAMFLKLIGIRPARESELAHSEEEIKIIVGESLKGGVLDSMESEIIKNAIDFSDTVAKEIMTPRKDVVCLNKKLSFEENMNIIIKSKYTRFPYIDGSKDSVLGMIHIRDILQNDLEGKIENLDKIVRKFIIVPENSSISKILVMMNKDRISAALVVDEYGGTAGLLTMEDIIEEIVGDINDEHDDKDQNYKKIADDTYEFNGRFELEGVEEIMRIRFDEETEQLTIGGYVFNLFERLPVVGDTIEDANCLYEVISMDGTSIGSIKVTLLNSKDDDEEEFD